MTVANPYADTEPSDELRATQGECQWCPAADFCGVEDGRPIERCPMRGDSAPTIMDVMRLLIVMQTGINQRLAQIMLLVNRHGHRPPGGV